nr:MAG TPA: PsbA, PsbB, PsbC, PsbD, PsbE-FCP supercomplex, PLANT PROTEIN [Caudoviricetes sp.]
MEQLSFFNKLLLLAYGVGVVVNCLILAAYYYCAEDDDEMAHPNVLQVLAMALFVLLSFIVWIIHWASKSQRNSNEKGGKDYG